MSPHVFVVVLKFFVLSSGDDQLNANRPLTLAERHKIRTNSKFFEEYINLEDGLLDELFAADVISNYHKQSINASKVPFERNQRLLSIIERRGVVQYKQFLQCLRITRQGHVAQVLETDGGELYLMAYFSTFLWFSLKADSLLCIIMCCEDKALYE